MSIENLVYIILFSRLFKLDFFKFWKSANSNVKMSMVLFFGYLTGHDFYYVQSRNHDTSKVHDHVFLIICRVLLPGSQ